MDDCLPYTIQHHPDCTRHMCGRSVKAIRSPHWTRQGTSGFARGLRQLPSPAAGAEVAKAALGVGERERIGDEAGFEGGGADDGAERKVLETSITSIGEKAGGVFRPRPHLILLWRGRRIGKFGNLIVVTEDERF
jgi:hypothetical protein